jgi:nucleotide-binding universal stress UspA family protein
MISKILVPTDASKAAQKAAEYAIYLAKSLGATVIVLSIVDERALASSAETAVPVVELESDLRKTAERYVEEITKLCHENGVQSKGLVTEGHPVEEIVKEASDSQADLIVMGSHGRSALTATILGSVAYGVIHRDNKIPVMVVRAES